MSVGQRGVEMEVQRKSREVTQMTFFLFFTLLCLCGKGVLRERYREKDERLREKKGRLE